MDEARSPSVDDEILRELVAIRTALETIRTAAVALVVIAVLGATVAVIALS